MSNNNESKDIIDKDEATIAEIASSWAKESGQSSEKIQTFILEKVSKGYLYHKEDTTNDSLIKHCFFSWLRWIDGSDELKDLGGLPYFWGDPWEGHPRSWDINKETNEYSLHDAITYLTTPEEYSELNILYCWIREVESPEDRDVDYLPIEGIHPKDSPADIYNNVLKQVKKKFAEHFKEGRLEMRGFFDGKDPELIPPHLADCIIMSATTDFKDSTACIGNRKVGGIKVYKITKPKVSPNTENTESIIRRLAEECIQTINKKKIPINTKREFVAEVLSLWDQNNYSQKHTKPDNSTAEKYVKGWKTDYQPRLWCFKKRIKT